MEQVFQLAQHRGNAARGAKILHVADASRLEVDQHRRRFAHLVHFLQIHLEAEPTGDSGEMDDGVGGPADREQHARRVLDRLLRHDAARTKARADQRNRDPPGLLGDAEPIGVDGGDRRGARGHHAERFGQRGHRARRPHHRAGACGRRQALLDLLDLGVADRARAMERPKAPAVRAGAEPLAVMAAGRHRAADELDRRNIRGGRAHQLRGHGLVASADEHDGVHRLGAHHLLDVHRHQIAKFQAGRMEKDLSQRDGREYDR